jgi:hypothetical protein
MAGYSANSGETDDRLLEKIWNHRWLLLASSLAGASWGFAGIFFMTRVLGVVDSPESRLGDMTSMFATFSIPGMSIGVPWYALVNARRLAKVQHKSFKQSLQGWFGLSFIISGFGFTLGFTGLFLWSVMPMMLNPLFFLFFLAFGFSIGILYGLFSMIPAGIIMAPLTQALWDAIARENTKHQDLPS